MHEFLKINGKTFGEKFLQILKSTDPNFQTQDLGETPLSIAVMNEDLDMINLLIENGAMLDYRVGHNLGCKTPLHIAAVNRKSRAVRVIFN